MKYKLNYVIERLEFFKKLNIIPDKKAIKVLIEVLEEIIEENES